MLRLPARNAKLEPWEELVHNVKNPQGRVTIAIVGKYVELKEAYKSLHEALVHGGIANRVAVDLRYVNSEEVTAENVAETFKGADGILVPGGFGYRGVEGKIESIRYARENNVPFFGICLGMQCAVIEFARHVVGIEEANSEEFNPFAKDKLIYLMTEWYDFRKRPWSAAMRKATREEPCASARIPAPFRKGRTLSKPTKRPISTNATVTATNSTMPTANALRIWAWFSAASPPMAHWWKSLKFPITHGSWAASSIPNSSPAQ